MTQPIEQLYRRITRRKIPRGLRAAWDATPRPERRPAYQYVQQTVRALERLRDFQKATLPRLRAVVASDKRNLWAWARYPSEFRKRFAAAQPARDRLDHAEQ